MGSPRKQSKAPPLSGSELLGAPAIRQVLAVAKSDATDEKQVKKIIEKIESGCNKFDHQRRGCLTTDEYYNVVKTQNGIDISKDDVRATGFLEDETSVLITEIDGTKNFDTILILILLQALN